MLDKGCRNKTKLITSVMIVLTLLQACNKEEDAQEHLQKGVEYLNNGEYEKAQLELKTSNQAITT
jgi:Tfp pilus assembly protein PilF